MGHIKLSAELADDRPVLNAYLGKHATTPQTIDGLPIERYHAGLELSNSGLLDFARSPFHYWSLHRDPNRPPRPSKPGQLEGSLAHCAILEPDQLTARYAIGPLVNRNTKNWHAFVDAPENKGMVCIQPDQYQAALAQAKAVHGLEDIGALLMDGTPERSAYWIDAETGVHCRCRPDWTAPVAKGDAVILLDVKTYKSAAPRDFMLQVARSSYHRQAAWYSDGYAAASGKIVSGFVFVAVESDWPHAAAAYVLPDEWLALARRENRELLQRYAYCNEHDEWPAFSAGVELLPMPAWLDRLID